MSQVIFTNHARQRLQERQFSEAWVEQAVLQPDYSKRGKQPGTSEFSKRFGTSLVTVVAHKNQSGEWLVVSAWIDPPVVGTADYRRKQHYLAYRKAPWWKKFILLVLRQIGIWTF